MPFGPMRNETTAKLPVLLLMMSWFPSLLTHLPINLSIEDSIFAYPARCGQPDLYQKFYQIKGNALNRYREKIRKTTARIQGEEAFWYSILRAFQKTAFVSWRIVHRPAGILN